MAGVRESRKKATPMNGQWTGTFSGTNSGDSVLDLDEYCRTRSLAATFERIIRLTERLPIDFARTKSV
jgi:hypothetical protein